MTHQIGIQQKKRGVLLIVVSHFLSVAVRSEKFIGVSRSEKFIGVSRKGEKPVCGAMFKHYR